VTIRDRSLLCAALALGAAGCIVLYDFDYADGVEGGGGAGTGAGGTAQGGGGGGGDGGAGGAPPLERFTLVLEGSDVTPLSLAVGPDSRTYVVGSWASGASSLFADGEAVLGMTGAGAVRATFLLVLESSGQVSKAQLLGSNDGVSAEQFESAQVVVALDGEVYVVTTFNEESLGQSADDDSWEVMIARVDPDTDEDSVPAVWTLPCFTNVAGPPFGAARLATPRLDDRVRVGFTYHPLGVDGTITCGECSMSVSQVSNEHGYFLDVSEDGTCVTPSIRIEASFLIPPSLATPLALRLDGLAEVDDRVYAAVSAELMPDPGLDDAVIFSPMSVEVMNPEPRVSTVGAVDGALPGPLLVGQGPFALVRIASGLPAPVVVTGGTTEDLTDFDFYLIENSIQESLHFGTPFAERALDVSGAGPYLIVGDVDDRASFNGVLVRDSVITHADGGGTPRPACAVPPCADAFWLHYDLELGFVNGEAFGDDEQQRIERGVLSPNGLATVLGHAVGTATLAGESIPSFGQPGDGRVFVARFDPRPAR
jgi:hypothetical protein